MKVMTARDAKNRFGEFLDTSQREPVVITKNGRPVGIMISIEDALDTVIPEMLLDREPGYDGWLLEKVSSTIQRVEARETELIEHSEAMRGIRERLKARFSEREHSQMRVAWTSEATDDLESIIARYHEQSRPATAEAVESQIVSQIAKLRYIPEQIPASERVPGSLELMIHHLPYIAFLCLTPDRIHVLNITHTIHKLP